MITEIKIEVSDSELFDSSDSDALTLIDQEESRDLLCKLLESAVVALYPKADVEIVKDENGRIKVYSDNCDLKAEEEAKEDTEAAFGGIFEDWDSWIVYDQEAIEKLYNCKFHWDNENSTWCLSGVDNGNAWESDDTPSGSEREALAEALEYLFEYNQEA